MTESFGGRVPRVRAAALLVFGVAVLFVLGGLPLQLFFGELGILAAQVGFILLPALLLVLLGNFDAATTLSLRFPSRRQVGGGILLLIGALQTALVLAWIQGLVMPIPVEYLEAMSDVLRADSFGRYLWLLTLAAVVPAIAEETLFRGVLLSSLRARVPALLAAALTGAVFGVFHLAPETAFRFLPTAWLGAVLAWVVILSGSLPLAILLHFLNNAAVLTLTALPLTTERFASADLPERPPILLGVIGVAFLIWGVRVLQSASRTRGGLPATDSSRSDSRRPESG